MTRMRANDGVGIAYYNKVHWQFNSDLNFMIACLFSSWTYPAVASWKPKGVARDLLALRGSEFIQSHQADSSRGCLLAHQAK